MALLQIDGNDAAFDITLGIGTAGAAVSLKCIATAVDVRTRRNNPVRPPTFCSNRWTRRSAGQQDTLIHIDGIGTVGSVASNPMKLFASATPLAFVVTATSACTWTGTCLAALDGANVQAAGNHIRAIDLESDDSVAVLWTET